MSALLNNNANPQGKFPWQFAAMIGSLGIGTLLLLLMLLEII